MSLTILVRQPEIREAFDRLAVKERTPASLLRCPLRVPDAGGPQGLAGTAFDYMARAQIVRDLGSRVAKLHVGTAASDRIAEHVEMVAPSDRVERKWKGHIAAAKAELDEYAAGRGDIQLVSRQVQYLALAEMAFRSGRDFDPEFESSAAVEDELLRLVELFGPAERYSPRKSCFLNPVFVASRWVGGADADLLLDDTLIDLKTTKVCRVEVEMLRQMAGYAALQSIGGLDLGEEVHTAPFAAVELYFARFGRSATWRISELFPADGFPQFCAVIRGVVEGNQRRFDEMMQRVEQRRSEAKARPRTKAAKKVKKRKKKR